MAKHKKRKLVIRIKKFLADMIPVLAGVLIALSLNNWQESRNNQKFVDGVMLAVSGEISENETELVTAIKQHQIILDTISEYIYNDSVSLADIINKVNGVQFIQIKNTAWKSFLNQNITLIDYEIISLLNNIEEGKVALNLQNEGLVKLIYDSLESTDTSMKIKLNLMLGDMFGNEEDILEEQRKFLKLIEKTK